MRNPKLLIIALCLIGVLFGWKAQKAWFSPPAAINPTKHPSIDLGLDDLSPVPRKDLVSAVAAVSGRPLFRPDRSFFSEDTPGDERDLSNLSMIGLMTLGGKTKGIVISKSSNPHTERWELQEGDSLLRFKVKEIREDGIVLVSEGREVLLPLYAGSPTVDEKSLRSQNTMRSPNRGTSRPGTPPARQNQTHEHGNVPGENQ
ncbi:MAG: general secretion pathway protein GspB [Syntrophorhabdaceae bacterium]|nr:general secretion pathway protein GspB [Syntrophorhabdaceae bacterium]